MNDIPWILASQERLTLRIGNAAYPTPAARRVALALGMLAVPADTAGMTATVVRDPVAICQTANAVGRAS